MRPGLKTILAVSGCVAALMGVAAAVGPAAAQPAVPKYRFDGSWPKPLPNKWMMQSVGGIFADKNDLIWVLARPRDAVARDLWAQQKPPLADCCVAPPSVIAFNAAGDVVHAWGGPGYTPGWPQNEHTIFVDYEGFVWVGGSVAGDTLQKFTKDGKLVTEFGHRGPKFDGPAEKQPANNQQTDVLLRGVSGAAIDDKAKELYFADGYLNKRVLVYDSVTFAFKRGWGAYGKPLAEITNDWIPRTMTPNDPPIKEFRPGLHCVAISNDGLVYICDRAGNRVQVFSKDGKFQKELIIAPETIGIGSAQSVAFSPDAKQIYLFITDTAKQTVWIVDRQTGKVAGNFGGRSYNGGDFGNIHFATADSKGNVYTGEIEPSKRVQKFSPVTPWAR